MSENATLIKFGLLEHLVQLRDQGLLYMNNLPYFWELEDEELCGDAFDSIEEIVRGKKGLLSDKNESQISIINWNIKILPIEAVKINIFCMYALRPKMGSYPVPPKNYKFGSHALVFLKPQEFINRVYVYLKNNNINAEADLVNYVDDSFAGKVGPFKKLRRFNYQSEWRLVCFDGPGKERELIIGNLQDISILMPIEEVNDRIKMNTDEAPNLFLL